MTEPLPPIVQPMYHSHLIQAYSFDPLFTFDLDHYVCDISALNVVLGINNISGRLLRDYCNVFLEFEEPNFLVRRDLSEYVDRTAALDRKLTLCPYTARLFNARIGREVVQPMFFPTNHDLFLRELGEPSLDAKPHDVVYVGYSDNTLIGQFRHRSTVPTDPVSMPTYLDKIRTLYATKIAICHNLLVYDEGSDDKRQLDALVPDFRRSSTTVPQLKSRMFESGFAKCILLVYYDDYNVAETFFTPNVDFLYFHSLEELDTTIARILTHYDDYRFLAENVYRTCCSQYTMTHFVDRYLRPPALAHQKRLARPPRRRCIILTTIHPPSAPIEFYGRLHQEEDPAGWDFIVVCDAKTDVYDYLWRQRVPCILLDLERQSELFPTLFDLVPVNSYARKMFGYLYAIQHGYEVIYETDDDNLVKAPSLDVPECARTCTVRASEEEGCNGFLNVYKMYTNAHIWARGIPPGHPAIDQEPGVITAGDQESHTSDVDVAIVQGLVDGDPDVDAVYRMAAAQAQDPPFVFDRSLDLGVDLAPGAVCPFNSQNTFWTDPNLFYAMYLPVTVSFRYTDILRGVIALFQLWKHGKTLRFTYPNAVQERNPHDLTQDLASEQTMYATIERVVELLRANPDAEMDAVYQLLADEGIVTQEEVIVVKEWLRIIAKC